MLSADAPVSQPLLTAAVADASHAELAAISERTGTKIEPRLFVGASDLPAAEREQIQIAYGSPDLVRMGAFGQFFDLIETLPRLRWLHLGFAGIDNPRFGAMLDRGVRLSNSPGAAAEPIDRPHCHGRAPLLGPALPPLPGAAA